MQSIITENAEETQKFAAELAEKFIRQPAEKKINKALILALEGELGAGKTTFTKGFSKALGVKEKVLSPTFVLIHKHKIHTPHSTFNILYHIDVYRLNSEKDLLKLGVKEIFANPENIVLIEWADRVKKIVPKNAAWIHFEHIDPEAEPSVRYGAGKNKRRVTIK